MMRTVIANRSELEPQVLNESCVPFGVLKRKIEDMRGKTKEVWALVNTKEPALIG